MTPNMPDRSSIVNKYFTYSLKHDNLPKPDMTIGIGYRCMDGVVLAADTQITQDFVSKQYESKFFLYPGTQSSLVSTYSGWPNLCKPMQREIAQRSNLLAQGVNPQSVQQAIQDVLDEQKKRRRNIANEQFLFALGMGGTVQLWETADNVVTPTSWACIGIGNNALIRYLHSTFYGGGKNLIQAAALAYYIVAQAILFVDKVGGDPEVHIVYPNGQVRQVGAIIGQFHKDLGKIFEMHADRQITDKMAESQLAEIAAGLRRTRML